MVTILEWVFFFLRGWAYDVLAGIVSVRGDQALKRKASPDHNVKGTHIMAASIIPQSTALGFTASTGVYQFGPAVTVIDLEDQLSAKQSQLNAMLSVAGESRLDSLSGSLASYFWACRMAAEEIQDLTAELLRRKGEQSS